MMSFTLRSQLTIGYFPTMLFGNYPSSLRTKEPLDTRRENNEKEKRIEEASVGEEMYDRVKSWS